MTMLQGARPTNGSGRLYRSVADLRLAMLVGFLLVGTAACSGCDEDPAPNTSVPSISFVAPDNNATLNAGAPGVDQNPAIEGVQPLFELQAVDVPVGSVLTLSSFEQSDAFTPFDTLDETVDSDTIEVTTLTVSPGVNRIAAEVRTANGALLAAAELTLTLDVDVPEPTIAIIDPDDGDTFSQDTDEDPNEDGVQIDLTVETSGVTPGDEIQVSVNGALDQTTEVLASDQQIISGVTLPFGDVTIAVRVLSEGGEARDTVNVTVEDLFQPCEISVTPEASDAICDFDAESDEDPITDGIQRAFTVETNCETVTVEVDGEQQIEQATGGAGEIDVVLTLKDGNNTLRFVASGEDVPEAEFEESYTVDAVTPTGDFFFPEGGELLTVINDLDGDLDNGINIDITLLVDGGEDEFLTGALDLNGTQVGSADIDEGDRFVFENVALTEEGENTLEFEVSDGCGNNSTSTITVNVSLLVQAVRIDVPETNTQFGPDEDLDPEAAGLQQNFTVSAIGFDPGTEVFIECRRATGQAFFRRSETVERADEATFDIPVTLPDGAYSCRARIEGEGVFSDEVLVAVSLVRQIVEITSPDEGDLFNTPTISVSARTVNVPDRALVTLTVGDATLQARVQDNGVLFEGAALSPGDNTLTVTVDAEQTPTDTINVILDVEPPVLGFTAPSDDDNVVEEADDATGSLEDGIQIDVQIQAQGLDEGAEVCVSADGGLETCAALDAEGNATIPAVEVTPGAVTLTASAEDAAGNTGTQTLVIDVQVDRPRLTITAPEDGSAVSQPTTDVTVDTDLADGTEVALFVNDAQAVTGTVDVNGAVTFTGVALVADQDNTLQARATDPRGEGRSPTIHVLVDTSIPTVVFIQPANGQTFNLGDEDIDGAPGFQTTVLVATPGLADGQPAVLDIDCDGVISQLEAEVEGEQASFEATLATVGSCGLTVTATNRADISGDASVTVGIDREAPTIRFLARTDGEVINITNDLDLDTPGVQINFLLEVDGLEGGQTVQLSGGPIADEQALEEGQNRVTFGPITLPDGELVLTATTEDAAGNEASIELSLLIDASPFALTFVGTPNPANLTANDDLDRDAEGLQTSLTVVGVPGMGGAELRLCSDTAPVDSAPCQTGGFRQIDAGALAFDQTNAFFDVTLPEGNQTIIAETEVDDTLVVSEPLVIAIDSLRPELVSFTLDSDILDPTGVINLLEDERPGLPGVAVQLTAQFEGLEEGRTVSLFDGGEVILGLPSDQDGNVVFLLTYNEDGAETLEVDTRDAAGNALEARGQIAFEIDLNAPTITIDNLTEGQQLGVADDNDVAPGLQFGLLATSNAIGRTATLYRVVGDLDPFGAIDDDEEIASGDVSLSGQVDFGGDITFPEGEHTLALRIDDAAGNAASTQVSIEIDVTAPTVTVLSPVGGTTFTTEEERFALRPGFQIEAVIVSDAIGAPVAIFDGDTQVSDAAVIDDQGQAQVLVTLSSGDFALEARVTDEVGNVGTAPAIDVTIDPPGCGIAFSAPADAVLRVATDNDNDPDNGVLLSFSTVVTDVGACEGQPVMLFINEQQSASINLTDAGTVDFTDITFASPGTYDVLAQVDDGEGNISTTAIIQVIVDLVPPTVAFTAPTENPAAFAQADDASGAPGLQTTIELQVANALGGVLTITSSLSQEPIAEDIEVDGEQINLVGLTFPEGEQTITATVTDIVGTEASATTDFVVDLTPPAAISVAGAVTNRRLGTTELVWVAPGDDGIEGFPTRYEVRRSKSAITDANFAAATLISEVEPQVAPQQEESFTVAELPWDPPLRTTTVTHFIAVRAFDDLGNTTAVGTNIEVTLALDESTFTLDGGGFRFGYRVHGVGDINNDGFDDIVTADLTDAAYVHYGSGDLAALDGTAPAPQVLRADGGFKTMGYKAQGLGDINGDGIDDMAVSGSLIGAVYLYFGVDGGQISDTPDVTLTGIGGEFGFDLGVTANFADINDEGLPDLIVGARSEAPAGVAYVILGRETWADLTMSEVELTNSANGVIRIEGATAADEFGFEVVGLSDNDDNGFTDIAISAVRADNGNNGTGLVYVFGGGALGTLTVADSTTLPTEANHNLHGTGMDAGDITGDGTIDLVVSAYATPDAITVYTFDDGIPTDTAENWSAPGGTLYGEQLNLADINGDGLLDLVVSGGRANDASVSTIDVYINKGGFFFGDGDLLEALNVRYERANNFGSDAGIGDFDGDGFDDIVTGQFGSSELVILF